MWSPPFTQDAGTVPATSPFTQNHTKRPSRSHGRAMKRKSDTSNGEIRGPARLRVAASASGVQSPLPLPRVPGAAPAALIREVTLFSLGAVLSPGAP